MVNEYPNGYPRLAARLNSDVNVQIIRRFGYLHNRILLRYQDRLSELEQDLKKTDLAESNQFRLNSRRYDEGPKGSSTRTVLLDGITSTLKEYDEFILRQSEILKLGKPEKRSLLNLLTWMWNEKPLCRVEHETLYRKDDLLMLSSDDDAWIISVSEFLVFALPRRLRRVSRTNLIPNWALTSPLQWLFPSPDKEKHAFAWSDKGMAVVVKLLLAFAAVLLLMLPTFLLLNIRANQSIRAIIVAVFALGFAFMISLLTRAKRHEMFAASAT